MISEYITDLRDDDVLLGRGSGPNDHEGNIRFRLLVAERKSEYMATNHRLTKAKIAQEIVDRVFANGGRFLRKLENDEIARFDVPDGVDAWAVATEETIMEKAKQALRQNTNKARPGLLSDDPKSKLSPRRLSPKPTSASRSPVPSSSTAPIPSVVGPRAMMSVPRLVDDFEPIPLDQAYASVPSITAGGGMARGTATTNTDQGRLNMNYGQQQPQLSAPSNRTMAPHDAYLQALSHTAPSRSNPAAANSRTTREEYSRNAAPTMHRGRDEGVDIGTASANALSRDSSGPPMTSPPQRIDTLDLQDDSILAHLPEHVRAKFLRGATAIASSSIEDEGVNLPPSYTATVGTRNASNQSMEQIPLDDDDYFDDAVVGNSVARNTQRLASMDMTDLARFHTRRERFQASEDNMSVVMDSFSKLKASEDGEQKIRYYNRRWSNQTSESERNRMLTSTDTMGTIDPIGIGSMADMSFATMNSSTFSLYRGNDPTGTDMASPNESIPSRVIVEADPTLASTAALGPSSSSGAPDESTTSYRPPTQAQQQPASGRFETSFSHTDLPVSRTAAARYQMSNPNRIREDYEEAYDGAVIHAPADGSTATHSINPPAPMPNRLGEDDPTGGDLGIDGMGLSSMELLKSAFHSSADWDISGPPTIPAASQSQTVQAPYQQQQPPPTA